MKDAATLAFAEQLAPAVRDVARQVEIHSSLVRTKSAPIATTASTLAATFAIGAAIGIGSAALWMR